MTCLLSHVLSWHFKETVIDDPLKSVHSCAEKDNPVSVPPHTWSIFLSNLILKVPVRCFACIPFMKACELGLLSVVLSKSISKKSRCKNFPLGWEEIHLLVVRSMFGILQMLFVLFTNSEKGGFQNYFGISESVLKCSPPCSFSSHCSLFLKFTFLFYLVNRDCHNLPLTSKMSERLCYIILQVVLPSLILQ